MFTYDTYQKVNNKGADQSVQMRRLVCAFVVRKARRQVFLHYGPYDIMSMGDITLYVITDITGYTLVYYLFNNI